MTQLLEFASNNPLTFIFMMALIIIPMAIIAEQAIEALGGKYKNFDWERHYAHKEKMSSIEKDKKAIRAACDAVKERVS